MSLKVCTVLLGVATLVCGQSIPMGRNYAGGRPILFGNGPPVGSGQGQMVMPGSDRAAGRRVKKKRVAAFDPSIALDTSIALPSGTPSTPQVFAPPATQPAAPAAPPMSLDIDFDGAAAQLLATYEADKEALQLQQENLEADLLALDDVLSTLAMQLEDGEAQHAMQLQNLDLTYQEDVNGLETELTSKNADIDTNLAAVQQQAAEIKEQIAMLEEQLKAVLAAEREMKEGRRKLERSGMDASRALQTNYEAVMREAKSQFQQFKDSTMKSIDEAERQKREISQAIKDMPRNYQKLETAYQRETEMLAGQLAMSEAKALEAEIMALQQKSRAKQQEAQRLMGSGR